MSMDNWNDNVTIYYSKPPDGVQIHLTLEQARFLVTILGKCNGASDGNLLHGLYYHLEDKGIEGYDTDLASIDVFNSYFR